MGTRRWWPAGWKGLLFLAALSQAVYLGLFTLRFPLPRLYATRPPVDYAKLTEYRLGDVALLFLAYVVLFAGLVAVMREWGLTLTPPSPLPFSQNWERGREARGEGVRAFVFASAVLFGLTLIFVYPVFAIDMLFYAVHSRLWLLHGANPLLVPTANFPQDPWISLKGEWLNTTSGYSPLWEVVALVPGFIAGAERFLLHVLGLKIIALLAYLADVLLLDRLLARLWPEERGWRLLYFAWNPLVLLELVGNGHNDGLMITFMLLALLWVAQGRDVASHVALALSVLIKVTPLFLWPLLYLWGLARRPTWRARFAYTLAVAGMVALTVGVFALFLWPDPTAWQVFHESESAGRSPQALGILAAMATGHLARPYTTVQNAFHTLFGLLYLGALVWAARCFWQLGHREQADRERTITLVRGWVLVLALLIAIFSSNWRPWYTTWLLALAPLLSSSAWQGGILTLSFTALVGDLFWTNVRWRFREFLTPVIAHVIGVAWVFGMPVVVSQLIIRDRT